MKKIFYIAAILLIGAVSVGCESGPTDEPAPPGDELVAIELSAAEGSVAVTRAVIDNAFYNVTFVVFKASDDSWLQTKTVNYGEGERLYLKRGASYKLFAVANLDSDNCSNPSLTGMTDMTLLKGMNIVAESTLGAMPSKVPMISGTLADPLVEIDLPGTLIHADSPEGTYLPNHTKYTLPLRSLYTRIEVNVYNRTDVASGVTPGSYYAENLPTASYIVEQDDDYAFTNTLYGESPLATSIPAPGASQVYFTQFPGNYYNKTTFNVYTLENRRGDGNPTVTDPHNRYDDAPPYATVINLISTVSSEPGVVLATYIHPGQGRAVEPNDPDDDDIDNYDIDRNSIYHVNVIINGVSNVLVDTRREYLEQVVCGELENPGDGGTSEW